MKVVIFNFTTTPILTEGIKQMMIKQEGLMVVFSVEDEEELEMLVEELAEENDGDDFTFFTL